jgi:Domain of unknown function (DUF4389)
MSYPVTLIVDYPDRQLNRLTTAFRLVWAIPILIVAGAVTAAGMSGGGSTLIAAGAGTGGVLFAAPLLMLVFRQKYPRWWFDWNVAWMRFSNRITAYLSLMDDHYPSTDEDQSVRFEVPYPNARRDLNRFLPLVKWLLAIPHYIVLLVLTIAGVFAVIGAWFAILVTGRYPRGLFDFMEGIIRYENRVAGYALLLATDEYPPFRLSA